MHRHLPICSNSPFYLRLQFSRVRLLCNINESRIVYLKNETTGADIFLIGTMHISESSAEEVRKVICDVKPDAVMVELDAKRAQRLREMSVSMKYDTKSLIPPGTLKFPHKAHILEMLLKKFYPFFRPMGIIPGKEFLVALTEAEKLGSQIILGDRNSKVTLRRLWRSFSISDIFRIYNMRIGNYELIQRAKTIDKSDPKWFIKFVESLKTRRDLKVMAGQMEKACPGLVRVLLHERDIYMINSIRKIPEKKIVAVVGLGHLDGMEKYWNKLSMRAKELNMKEEDLYQP